MNVETFKLNSLEQDQPLVLAGFKRRGAANIIDVLVLGVLMLLVIYIDIPANGNIILIEEIVVLLLWGLFYYPLMEGSPLQSSVGKLLVGIQVVDSGGNRLTFKQAKKRHDVKGKYWVWYRDYVGPRLASRDLWDRYAEKGMRPWDDETKTFVIVRGE